MAPAASRLTVPQSACPPTLAALLEAMDPDADAVHRHLWLITLFDWIRGNDPSAELAPARVAALLNAVEASPEITVRMQVWWRTLIDSVDGTILLSDYGFASRNAFISELIERLHYKLLPTSPETSDASALFALVLPGASDAQWLAALPEPTLERLARLLSAPASSAPMEGTPAPTHWQATLLEAITFCTSQIRAAGFSPEIRLRMSTPALEASPFHSLASDFDAVRAAWLARQRGVGTHDDVVRAVHHFRAQLDACRQAAASVYTHLDTHGISVDLVFRLRQLRERALRIRALLDCLLGEPTHRHTAQLVSHLASVGQQQRSLRALFAHSTSLLAAKVAERNSETGEHYITRTRGEYRTMLGQAAGGGALTAATTFLKFSVVALGLSAFWYGFWSGVVYAASFVVIQLLHCTLATKQPAMTAPAMAAKLRDFSDASALKDFVDEVTHLVRSQVAAVLGNVAVVLPVAVLLSWGIYLLSGRQMIDQKEASHVLHSLHLLGPSLLFAAFTGVLLFASSILAGWAENWFVLHRLDSAIRYNPRITRRLGVARAARWAHFMRHNVSGFASNISLGFMLGLLPAILGFLGLGLEARHVTLSAGQLGAACASLGWEVMRNPALWWAVASVPLIAALNLGVSFYLAFNVALEAHRVSGLGRVRIRRAVMERLRQAPQSFLARPGGSLMGEFELIQRYFTRPVHQAVLGVGDDCALLQPRAGMQLAVSTDMLVSGRHFFADVDPHTLGHKALAVNLSDLAACGARPLAFTLALALPQAMDAWLAPFANGLWALADAHGCELIGGDTTQGPLNICITVFGEVPAGQALLRSGARAGDDLYVSGTLGDARLALEVLQGRLQLPDPVFATARQRLEMPTPRLALGQALRGVASACADVSDGLLGDLGHILQRSGVGATVQTEIAISLIAACAHYTGGTGTFEHQIGSQRALQCVLGGGDDYELVFTAPPTQRGAVQAAALASGTPVTRIGQIDAAPGLRLRDAQGTPVDGAFASFDHFAS